MERKPLYQEIITAIQQEIALGKLKPGDSLPSVREMAEKWDCAPGTIQRVYKELNQSGLVISRPRVGVQVTQQAGDAPQPSLQRAKLINQTESFILTVLSSGYAPTDIDFAFQLALDRWRIQPPESQDTSSDLKYAGSHDPALSMVLSHLKHQIRISYTGSMGGLIALANHTTDLAGCHLLDPETGEYNKPYIHHLLPGRRVALVRLADRYMGIIAAAGNPLNIRTVRDLTHPGIRFINRQEGAGTRVWLDFELRKKHIQPDQIAGYEIEAQTHTEVAQRIANGQADAGLGIFAAAHAFDLGFVQLTTESYDLIVPEENWDHPTIQHLINSLANPETKKLIDRSGGYDTRDTGRVEWLDA